MALRVVERHGFEFQPHPEITAGEPAPRFLPASGSQGWKVGRGRSAWGGIRVSSLVFALTGLIVGIAALPIAKLYVAGRVPSLPFGSQLVARLVFATAIGLLLTAVHKGVRNSRTAGYSLGRAQTLLCLAGALTMLLIDNSVARAFAIAGAASIVRFRTPVDDPTDAMVLFLAMVLGMASGVGAFGVSIVGAAGVCLLLIAFSTVTPEPRQRTVTIELVANGREFPSSHVQRIFARHRVAIEPSEWSQDTATRVKYRACVNEAVPLDLLGAELMNNGDAGLHSVEWEIRRAGQ
jgi:hypothetical protein